MTGLMSTQPVRPGVESTAKQDHLPSLLLQVHVHKIDRLQQLIIHECCGSIVKLLILTADIWQGCIYL